MESPSPCRAAGERQKAVVRLTTDHGLEKLDLPALPLYLKTDNTESMRPS
jgi:hypothetical protein